MFKWCRDRGLIESNPIADLKGPAPLASRDRVLAARELHAFWTVVATFDWPFGPLLQLLLLTGQRRTEVAGMRWQAIDLDKAVWTIPRERTKNGIEHFVDLSPQALAIIRRLPGLPEAIGSDGQQMFTHHHRSGLIFSTTGKTSVSGFSKIKRRLDIKMAAVLGLSVEGQPEIPETMGRTSLKPWRLHDLRRTMATMMGEELEIDPGVIERILNHISGSQGGLQGVYQRQQYRQKRKEAIISWGEYIEHLMMPCVPSTSLPSSANTPSLLLARLG